MVKLAIAMIALRPIQWLKIWGKKKKEILSVAASQHHQQITVVMTLPYLGSQHGADKATGPEHGHSGGPLGICVGLALRVEGLPVHPK